MLQSSLQHQASPRNQGTAASRGPQQTALSAEQVDAELRALTKAALLRQLRGSNSAAGGEPLNTEGSRSLEEATALLEETVSKVRALTEEVGAHRNDLARFHRLHETDKETLAELQEIQADQHLQAFYSCLYTELNQHFVGAIAATSGLMKLELDGAATMKSMAAGKGASAMAAQAGMCASAHPFLPL